jgi:hypothetical protein
MALLAMGLLAILTFSPWWVLLIITMMAGYHMYRLRKDRLKKQPIKPS